MGLITIFGASGFIGSHLVAELERRQIQHSSIRRDDKVPRQHLGEVIYCIGVTADFRSKPFETVEAHVCKLGEVLQSCEFTSFTYLSSTRVYANNSATASEEDPLVVMPAKAADLYNISKAMGESLTLNCGKTTRVVRLSNVYGDDFNSDNFLPTLIKDAVTTRKLVFQTAPESSKDFISINDAVGTLIEISTRGRERVYNLAAGENVTNRELAQSFSKTLGCTIEFAANAPRVSFPPISINRLKTEFAFKPRRLLDDLEQLIASYQKQSRDNHD
jgi:nucleoside-diphosphate-sugar epimerase